VGQAARLVAGNGAPRDFTHVTEHQIIPLPIFHFGLIEELPVRVHLTGHLSPSGAIGPGLFFPPNTEQGQ